MVLRFDNDKNAILSLKDMVEKVDNMPETIVAFFDSKILDYFLKEYKSEQIASTSIKRLPVYKININGKDVAVFLTGIGAPLCVALCEELCYMGIKNILMFGACGVLTDIKEASIILPTSAVRDEGTSFHYAEPSDEIKLNEKYVNRLIQLCKDSSVDFITGKTWSNDAFYRETKGKIIEMQNRGCICVEMECSAMTAFANFRGVNFAQFFYAADSLAKEDWDVRILQDSKMNGEERALALALDWASKLF